MAAAFEMLIAGCILVTIGLFFWDSGRFGFDPRGLAALVSLVIFGSLLRYGSFIYALAKLPATKVSMYAYINPVIAVLLGWLVLGERLDRFVILSTAVILLGVVLVKSSKV
jgi:drug/metabolite transporter (DMT)-like permease